MRLAAQTHTPVELYDKHGVRTRFHPAVKAQLSPLDRLFQEQAKHPVPPEWLAPLHAIAPKNDQVSWLTFRWLSSAERFVIDECIPAAFIPTEKREQLAGVPWWQLPKKAQEGRRRMVSAYQWWMYREHRVWARPFWCLQGIGGGTPARYSDIEQKLLKAMGQETDPPAPGSLPYAPFDERAITAVRARDALRRYNDSLARLRNSGNAALLKAEDEAAEEQFRRIFWDWWKETMQPQVDFLTWYGKSDSRTAGVNAGLMRPATEEETQIGHNLEETFITTGTVPYTSMDTDVEIKS